MNLHLTNRQILDAQFKLGSSAQTEAAAAHLNECAECQARSAALKRKFAALDLLREHVHAPESLIAETLRQTHHQPAAARKFFPRLAWPMGVAAAIAVVFILLYTPGLETPPIQMAMTIQECPPTATEATAPKAKGDSIELAAAPRVDSGSIAGQRLGGRGDILRKTARTSQFITAPVASLKDWSASPETVNIHVSPAMIEFSDAVSGLKKDSRLCAKQCVIAVSNPSSQPITATLTKTFTSTNWSVGVTEKDVQVSTQEPTRVCLTIDLSAFESKRIHCTTILPAEPVKGVEP